MLCVVRCMEGSTRIIMLKCLTPLICGGKGLRLGEVQYIVYAVGVGSEAAS